MTRLVHNWGVNDVNYNVTRYAVLDGKKKQVWVCPYYSKWKGILERGCCPLYKNKYPSYKDVIVCETWKYLSNFIEWVDEQPNRNWMNCEPDKDLLSVENKVYSPSTVVFIGKRENYFTTDRAALRGEYMIGVSPSRTSKKNPYMAQCHNPFTTKQEYLGLFPTELQAHKAWKEKKHYYACQLAELQQDSRVADALRNLYKD